MCSKRQHYWPGTTAIVASCPGARRRGRRPIPIGSGSPRSCCSRRRCARSALLRALSGALADGREPGRNPARGGAENLGRARLLRPRPQPARLRQGRGRAAWRAFPGERGGAARASGHRRLYRRRDRGHCLRSTGVLRSTAMSSGSLRGSLRSRTPLPGAKPEVRRRAQALTPARARAISRRRSWISAPPSARPGNRPACCAPGWQHCAARTRGEPESFPRREPKREGRLRRGAAFVVVRADQAVLLRRRPEKGLLGGMSEVPTTAWTHDFDARVRARRRRSEARWRSLPGVVTHVFTHFPLELVVYRAEVPTETPAPVGSRWVPLDESRGRSAAECDAQGVRACVARCAATAAPLPLARQSD